MYMDNMKKVIADGFFFHPRALNGHDGSLIWRDWIVSEVLSGIFLGRFLVLFFPPDSLFPIWQNFLNSYIRWVQIFFSSLKYEMNTLVVTCIFLVPLEDYLGLNHLLNLNFLFFPYLDDDQLRNFHGGWDVENFAKVYFTVKTLFTSIWRQQS